MFIKTLKPVVARESGGKANKSQTDKIEEIGYVIWQKSIASLLDNHFTLKCKKLNII